MQVAVDIGNTRTKIGLFKEQQLERVHIYKNDNVLWKKLLLLSYKDLIFSNTGRSKEDPLYKKLLKLATVEVSAHLSNLPLQISYRTPETLGADRISAAVGVSYLYPKKDCLIVDMGTCVTYTLVRANRKDFAQLLGGTISPGLYLRLKSLTLGTTSLIDVSVRSGVALLGRSTKSSIQSGLWHGLREEIQGLIQSYTKLYPELIVVLSGGDTKHLSVQTKTPTFANKELVLIGMQHILQVHLDMEKTLVPKNK